MHKFRCQRWYSALASKSNVSVKIENKIATVALCRIESRNALGRDMIRSLRSAVADIAADSSINVAIFYSSVPKVFCAGADLKERAKMNDLEVSEFVSTLRRSFGEIEHLPMPTIAALDGAAVGGGLELALACDIRIGGSGAILGLVETKLGIIPGAGGTQRLPRLIGIPRAKELIFTGRRMDAPTAYHLGILNHFVEEGSVFDKSMEIAKEISSGAPLALRAAKIAINEGTNVNITTGMSIERLCYAQVIKTEDRLEGIRAFAEKRAAQFKGH